jgi:hypothetical protein
LFQTKFENKQENKTNFEFENNLQNKKRKLETLDEIDESEFQISDEKKMKFSKDNIHEEEEEILEKQNTENYVEKSFPIPEENRIPMIIKIYEEENNTIKVCDLFEFVGILSKDKYQNNEILTEEKIPQIHVLYYKKLKNPNISNFEEDIFNNLQKNSLEIRNSLIEYLSKPFNGDLLVGEYLLIHLISNMYF